MSLRLLNVNLSDMIWGVCFADYWIAVMLNGLMHGSNCNLTVSKQFAEMNEVSV